MKYNVIIMAALLGLAVSAQAQNDTVAGNPNPLWSTTGPSVLPEGGVQWDNSVDWSVMRSRGEDMGVDRYDYLGGRSVFRFGVGSKAELTLGVASGTALYHTAADYDTTVGSFAPQVGMRMSLYGGKGLLPLITFNTSISWVYDYLGQSGMVQPSLGMEFRNRIGRRWAIDYSLGYAWNNSSYGPVRNQITYSLFARWLAADKLMLGLGVENGEGKMAVLYQPADNLQLSLQGNISGIAGLTSYSYRHSLSLGVSWRIR